MHPFDAPPVPRRRFAWLTMAMVLLIAATLMTAFQTAPAAQAADLSKFKPGNIIEDGVFFDTGTMTEAQIQTFLNSKVSSCASGATCLKDFRQTTYDRTADAMCKGYTGASNESAARIIKKVADSCGINPQVILVMLQKEQGLVLSRQPSSWAWQASMGYACPDTAACDTKYFGFYNQVYMGMWQLKRYGNPPGTSNYFTWFPIGKAAPIRFSPNASCGSANVIVENKATASLYYYTPYQPNAAALAAGYGASSDSTCSAYGNRNFYNYFTDWFGSTVGSGYLVRSESNPDIFLVSGTSKYFVPSMEIFHALAALGPYRVVSNTYLSSFAGSVKTAGTTVRDPLSGIIYRIENGRKHQYPTCELVSAYGSSCAAAIDLTTEQLNRFGSGAAVSTYFLIAGSPTVYSLSGTTKHPLSSWETLLAFNNGVVPHLSTITTTAANKLATGKTLLEPLTLVKSASDPRVYLVDGRDSVIGVPSFAVPAEFGSTGYSVVPDTVLAGYKKSTQVLSLGVRCNARTWVASEGRLRASGSVATSGLPITDVSADFCSRVPAGATADGTAMFVQASGSQAVHLVRAGKTSAIGSWSAAIALNGGATPQVLALSAANLASIPVGPAILAPASLARTSAEPMIYLVDGLDKKIAVGSFTTTSELGIPGWSYADAGTLAPLAVVAGQISRQVTCGGTTWFAAGGTLSPITAPTVTGLPTSTISELTCGHLKRSGAQAVSIVFVKSSDSDTVYRIVDGTKRAITSWDQVISMNGGSAPAILSARAQGLADIPTGKQY